MRPPPRRRASAEFAAGDPNQGRMALRAVRGFSGGARRAHVGSPSQSTDGSESHPYLRQNDRPLSRPVQNVRRPCRAPTLHSILFATFHENFTLPSFVRSSPRRPRTQPPRAPATCVVVTLLTRNSTPNRSIHGRAAFTSPPPSSTRSSAPPNSAAARSPTPPTSTSKVPSPKSSAAIISTTASASDQRPVNRPRIQASRGLRQPTRQRQRPRGHVAAVQLRRFSQGTNSVRRIGRWSRHDGRSAGKDRPTPTRHDRKGFHLSLNLIAGVKFPTGSAGRIKEEFSEVEIPGATPSGIHGHDLALGSGRMTRCRCGDVRAIQGRVFPGECAIHGSYDGRVRLPLCERRVVRRGTGIFPVARPGLGQLSPVTLGVQFVVSGEHKNRDTFRGEIATERA